MDSKQLAAWLARGHAALHATFPPRTRKQFAGLMLDSGLWSTNRLSLDSAVARVGDCLNPQRGGGQSFRVSELWLWMHESGNHALYEAMTDDLGYRSEPVPDEAREQELLTRIDARLAAVADELADLRTLREQLSGTHRPETSPILSDEPVRFSKYEPEGF